MTAFAAISELFCGSGDEPPSPFVASIDSDVMFRIHRRHVFELYSAEHVLGSLHGASWQIVLALIRARDEAVRRCERYVDIVMEHGHRAARLRSACTGR